MAAEIFISVFYLHGMAAMKARSSFILKVINYFRCSTKSLVRLFLHRHWTSCVYCVIRYEIMARQCIIGELLHWGSGCWRLNGHRRERWNGRRKKIFVNQVNFPRRNNEVCRVWSWGECVGCVSCEAACSTHTHGALKGYLGCLFIRPERAFPLATGSLTAQER